ncbi:MAG TPA: hypothetical protein VIL09_01735 [Microvirga sp.]|jgi:hypothetical protein
MRNLLKMLAVAGLVAVTGGAAHAQGINLRIGVDDGPRRIERRVIDRDYRRPVTSRRVIERRIVRPAPVRTVCRTVIRERVRPNGVVVRRPTEVCRRVVAGRRTYID